MWGWSRLNVKLWYWAVAMGTLGCGTAGADAQQAPSFPGLPPDLAVGEGRTQPCLDTVEGEALCGRFRVYEDRDARAGRSPIPSLFASTTTGIGYATGRSRFSAPI